MAELHRVARRSVVLAFACASAVLALTAAPAAAAPTATLVRGDGNKLEVRITTDAPLVRST